MLTYLTSGESHGPQLTAVIDGLPAGLTVDLEQINYQLSRRQKGFGRGGRQKIEQDEARLVSGVRHGVTLGGPITMTIENRDWINWAPIMDPVKPPDGKLTPKQEQLLKDTTRPRPGHADLAAGIKWHHRDLRNVLERASARETAARVALGALVRQLLEQFNVKLASHVVSIGSVALEAEIDRSDLAEMVATTEASEVRCLDSETSERMKDAIRLAGSNRDTLGGVAEVIVRGLPVGLGGCSQWFDRLEGQLAAALMSIQSVKGVEIGLGFEVARRSGSEAHDQIYYDSEGDPARKRFFRKSNRAGGIEGGVTNGEDIIARVAAKPISTLMQPLDTVDVVSKQPAEAMVERSDICVVPAIAVICEAVTALVLTEAFLKKFGSDNMTETKRNFQAYLAAEY
jgi:chorismate synthase